MQAPARGSFDDAWPRLAKVVDTMLASKQVPSHVAEDIVQETGLRLLRMWPEVDGSRSGSLAVTIALNLVRDHARQSAHLAGDPVPDAPAPFDLERAVLARLELGRVRRALRALKPEYRQTLLAEVDYRQVTPKGAPGTIRVMRLRARRALEALLERPGWGAVPGLERVRQAIEWTLSAPSIKETITNGAPAIAAAVIAVGASIPGLSPGVRGSEDAPAPDIAITAPHEILPAPTSIALAPPPTVVASDRDLDAARPEVADVSVDEPAIDTGLTDDVDEPDVPDAPDVRAAAGPIEAEVDGGTSVADDPLKAGVEVADKASGVAVGTSEMVGRGIDLLP